MSFDPDDLRSGLVLHPQVLAVSDPSMIAKLDRPAWSPSSVSSFHGCPGRWAASRLMASVPDPFGAAEAGTAGHLALEMLFALPGPERTLDRVARIIESFDRSHADGDHRSDIDVPASAADRLRWRALVLDKIAGLWTLEDPRKVRILGLERSLAGASIDGVPFIGYMDRTSAIVDSAGNVIGSRVEDYKTGKASPPYKRTKFGDDKAEQMIAYGLALESLDGVRPDELTLLFVSAAAPESYSPEMTVKSVDAVRSKFTATWSDMKSSASSGAYALKPTPLCGWCPLATVCPAADAAGKSEPKIPAARTGELLSLPLASLSVAVPDLFGSPAPVTVPPRNAHAAPVSSSTSTTKGAPPMSNLFATAEIQPWNEVDPSSGLLNPASYAAIASFSLVEMATTALFEAKVPVTKDAVPALASVFAHVVAEAQSEVFGKTSMQAGSHTRLRGALRTAIETIPLPFGQGDDAWAVWQKKVIRRLISTATTAGELYVAGPQDAAWGPLVSLVPNTPAVPAA